MIFKAFLEKSGYERKQFPGFPMDNLPLVEDVLEKNISIYDIDIEEEIRRSSSEKYIARRSIGKYENTVKFLRYNNHIINFNNIDNFFKGFLSPIGDTF